MNITEKVQHVLCMARCFCYLTHLGAQLHLVDVCQICVTKEEWELTKILHMGNNIQTRIAVSPFISNFLLETQRNRHNGSFVLHVIITKFTTCAHGQKGMPTKVHDSRFLLQHLNVLFLRLLILMLQDYIKTFSVQSYLDAPAN